MEWAGRLASRWKYPEQRVWFAVLAWAVALTAIALAASASYSTVIFAHTAASLTASRAVTFSGTTGAGVLLNNGSVNLTIRLTVSNPSSRVLTFTSIAYKAWIEDLPAEAGLPNLGRSDNIFQNQTGTHYFFRAFAGSMDIAPVPVPAYGAGTEAVSFILSRVSDVARFTAVQNISQYAAQVRGSGVSMPWIHWVSLVLTLRDLPSPTATSNPYLVALTRIVIEEGPNLG
jgi:hypothetical protein